MNNPAPLSQRAPAPHGELLDTRFRALIGRHGWHALPAAVRRRFSHRIGSGEMIVYRGRVTETRLSRAGWLLAQIARLLGGPLPTDDQTEAPSVVTVSNDPGGSGQLWSRQYARRRGFPQTIHSVKCFAGPTGLEERIGAGIGMALRVHVRQDRLIFSSEHFFWRGFGCRLRLPHWLLPLHIEVIHANRDQRSFSFELRVEHAWLGSLIRQRARYQET